MTLSKKKIAEASPEQEKPTTEIVYGGIELLEVNSSEVVLALFTQ